MHRHKALPVPVAVQQDEAMDDARHLAVVPLLTLASNADYRDRADAGRGLAIFADVEQACKPLLTLVLDTRDTFVTRATTQALLRRHDKIGYAVISRALVTADDNHSDWIHTAIADVFGMYGRERDTAIQECQTLLDDTDTQVSAGAPLLVAALTSLTPALLRPERGATQLAVPTSPTRNEG
jgi:hypothetical protein